MIIAILRSFFYLIEDYYLIYVMCKRLDIRIGAIASDYILESAGAEKFSYHTR